MIYDKLACLKSLISGIVLGRCCSGLLILVLVLVIIFCCIAVTEAIEVETILGSLRLFSFLLDSLLSQLLTGLCLMGSILHHNSSRFNASSLVMRCRVFLTVAASLRVLRKQSEMMEDNRPSDSYVERSSLVRVLRNVDKVITHGNLGRVQTTAFVA